MEETLRSNRFGKLTNLNIESTSQYPKFQFHTDGPIYQYTPELYLWETTIDLCYLGYNLVFRKDLSQQEYNKLWGLLEMNYDIDYNPNDAKFVRNKNEKNLF